MEYYDKNDKLRRFAEETTYFGNFSQTQSEIFKTCFDNKGNNEHVSDGRKLHVKHI